MIPFILITIGVVYSLLSYIPKSWVEKHIVKEIDPKEIKF